MHKHVWTCCDMQTCSCGPADYVGVRRASQLSDINICMQNKGVDELCFLSNRLQQQMMPRDVSQSPALYTVHRHHYSYTRGQLLLSF